MTAAHCAHLKFLLTHCASCSISADDGIPLLLKKEEDEEEEEENKKDKS